MFSVRYESTSCILLRRTLCFKGLIRIYEFYNIASEIIIKVLYLFRCSVLFPESRKLEHDLTYKFYNLLGVCMFLCEVPDRASTIPNLLHFLRRAS